VELRRLVTPLLLAASLLAGHAGASCPRRLYGFRGSVHAGGAAANRVRIGLSMDGRKPAAEASTDSRGAFSANTWFDTTSPGSSSSPARPCGAIPTHVEIVITAPGYQPYRATFEMKSLHSGTNGEGMIFDLPPIELEARKK
jgi:hypothetical protein